MPSVKYAVSATNVFYKSAEIFGTHKQILSYVLGSGGSLYQWNVYGKRSLRYLFAKSANGREEVRKTWRKAKAKHRHSIYVMERRNAAQRQDAIKMVVTACLLRTLITQ